MPTVRKARETRGPVLIDFRVEQEEAVYPMVPAGSDLARHDPPAGRGEAAEVTLVKHTLVAKVLDQPGVLNRVASLFRRRGFNIDSLTVGHTETPESRA